MERSELKCKDSYGHNREFLEVLKQVSLARVEQRVRSTGYRIIFRENISSHGNSKKDHHYYLSPIF